MAGLENVWVCALDLQLVRADRIVSLLVPVSSRHDAAPPGDLNLHTAIYADVSGGTAGGSVSRVKLADCGKTPAGELLAGLARALGSAGNAGQASGEGCLFVFAEQDAAGISRWVSASRLPGAWPQSDSPDGAPAALSRSPLA